MDVFGAVRISVVVTLTVLGAFVSLGCRDSVDSKPLNVVVITVDTLRADHLGTYGFRLPTSPHIDAFAARSVTFERNWSQAPCTFPSVNSLMTSRYPSHFRDDDGEVDFGIPESIPTLAEMLWKRGYTTHAVSASPIVRATPSPMNPSGGFGRGFDTFDETCLWNNVQCINEHVDYLLRWLAPRRVFWTRNEERTPFFLYLHYMDPHDPYVTPAIFDPPFSGIYEGQNEWVREGNPNPVAEMIYGGGPAVRFDSSDIDYLRARYDDGIAYLDQGIGELLGALEERKLLDETVVIVLSDHGESFMEHGQIKHCYHLYEHNLRTPMIISVPGAEPGKRVAVPTSNLDLVPTILDYIDERLRVEVVSSAARFSADIQGRSLRGLIDGETTGGTQRSEGDFIFASMGKYRAVTEGSFKLIYDLETREATLFDLDNDPEETTDLSRDARRDLHRLRNALLEWLESEEGEDAALARAGEAQEQLRALGYLQ